MPSTYDPLLRLELQATGENATTWGIKTNTNLELLADSVAGAVNLNVAGSGDYTLSTANGADDEARQAILVLTGTLTGNRNIIVPASPKTYTVINNTTGAFTVTLKQAASTGVVIPQGGPSIVVCTSVTAIDAVGATPYIKSFLNDPDAATARITLGATTVGAALFTAADAGAARATLGAEAGFRNLIINGNPIINQRAYGSGTATTAANQYTLDRWRVVVSGQAVSWTDSAGVRTVTAPTGGMEQVIEGASIIAGTYTMSWTGTATATVNGNAVANGGQVTLTGGADATVRMTGGTWSLLQLEPGNVATTFERRPVAIEIALCERYFENGAANFIGSAYTAGALVGQQINFRTRKRTTPVIVVGTAIENVNLTTTFLSPITDLGFRHYGEAAAAGNVVMTRSYSASAEF